jgi:pimeloyl-ACP methyl ester carboxylesterase
MKTERADAAPSRAWRVDSVGSADGTTVGWRSTGSGPAVLVVHGAMQSASSQRDLALILGESFTVHLLDRRGRGLSGPYVLDRSSVEQEVQDITAVLRATGARDAFGVSSGALLLLHVALDAPHALDRIALFEPPLREADWPSVRATIQRMEQHEAAGDRAGAMVTAMLAAEMGPSWFGYIPRRLLAWLTELGMRHEERKPTEDGHVPMRSLGALLRHDFDVVAESSADVGRFAAMDAEVLLLNGSRTRPYLVAATEELEGVLRARRRTVLAGAGHEVTGNREMRGRPAVVARELETFFRR